MSLSRALMLLNYGVVLLYGVFLTASFAGALKTKKDGLRVLCFSVPLMAIQAGCFHYLGLADTEKLYPFLIHLPLALLLIFVCKRKAKETFPAVFISYLCCIPRQWLGMLAAALFGRGTGLSYAVQILFSFPLFWLTIRFLSPTLSRMLNRSEKSVAVLTAAPFLYYLFVYATTVYSDMLYKGGQVMLGFILSTLVLSYFFSTVLYTHEAHGRSEAEKTRELLRLQTEQAVKNLEAMRSSQQQAAAYRHDLRHHFQYLAACMDAGRLTEARDYIRQSCEAIETQKVTVYCENEAVNLILSAYQTKADAAGTELQIWVSLSEPLHLPTGDLCIVLSNGLENALHACEALAPSRKRTVSVQGYQKNGRTFFQIQNPCDGDIPFESGRPAANREGHGLGTLSIAETVKRHGGLCVFSAEDGLFTLRFWI